MYVSLCVCVWCAVALTHFCPQHHNDKSFHSESAKPWIWARIHMCILDQNFWFILMNFHHFSAHAILTFLMLNLQVFMMYVYIRRIWPYVANKVFNVKVILSASNSTFFFIFSCSSHPSHFIGLFHGLAMLLVKWTKIKFLQNIFVSMKTWCNLNWNWPIKPFSYDIEIDFHNIKIQNVFPPLIWLAGFAKTTWWLFTWKLFAFNDAEIIFYANCNIFAIKVVVFSRNDDDDVVKASGKCMATKYNFQPFQVLSQKNKIVMMNKAYQNLWYCKHLRVSNVFMLHSSCCYRLYLFTNRLLNRCEFQVFSLRCNAKMG